MMSSNIYLVEREDMLRKGTGNYTKKTILIDVSFLPTEAVYSINMEMELGLRFQLK